MSTKTSIKRIAAVAAVALTLGGFSAVSAHAADNAVLKFAAGDGAGAAPYNTGAGIAGPANTVSLTYVQDSGKRALVTVSGAGATIASGGTVNTAGTSALQVTGSSTTTIVVNTPTVGTITASVYLESGSATGLYSATATETVAITVNATGLNNIYSAPTVYAYTGDTSTVAAATSTTDAAFSVSAAGNTPGTTPVAMFSVVQKDANAVALTSGWKAITVSTTIGTLQTTYGTNVGSYVSVTPGSSAAVGFWLAPNGQTGTATVTIGVNGVTAKTYTATLTSTSVKAVTLTDAYTNVATAATVGNLTPKTYNFVAAAKDSNGNVIKSTSTLVVTLGDATIATASSVGAYDSTLGGYPVTITGGVAGSTTVKVADSGATVSATSTVNVVAATASTIALTLDAASYSAGDKITATLTATNSAGKPVADGAYTTAAAGGILTATLASNVSLPNSATPFSTVTFVGGKATSTFYAPSSSFTVSGTTGTSAALAAAVQGAALSASATVTNAAADAAQAAVDAANEATDAANAATDAANNAMDSADAAQQAALDAGDKADAALAAVTDLASKVADIATQISALSSLVSKIAASVAKISAKVKA